MLKIFKFSALMVVVGLVACGGGGGSPGSSDLPYSISMRAEKTQLPINIGNQPAGIGAYASYTTTIYVEARKGGTPIPGGEDIFACNIASGLDSGALYYLDGDSEHEDDDGNPLAYRSVTLGSNSGGASFHFHAINKSGTARVTCSVTNPSDNLVSSASVDIVVGAATGKPANVIATTMAPFALGSKLNTSLVPDNVGIQAFVRDDANQPIPNPSGGANLQVSIRPFGAYLGARLLSGNQSGNVLQVRTISGVGQISLSSGSDTGAILLEYATDRFDNDVSNGIQDPIVSLHAVSVSNTVGSGAPLVISGAESIAVTAGNTFAYAFSLEGGVGPFTWSTIGGLPAGLTLDSSGVISGTTSASAGDYSVVLRVVDGAGAVAIKNVKITVTAAPTAPTTPTTPTTPTIGPLVFTVNGCSSAVGTACPLPAAVSTGSYAYAFSASGGDTTKPVTWIFSGVPGWLTSATAGNNGVINGTPPAGAACVNFLVTATRDTLSVTRQVSIAVNGGVCP
jgi:hypothetical protein